MDTNSEKLIPPPLRIFQMISGFWSSQCLYAAAKLDIADHVSGTPKHIDKIAEETKTHSASLYRVMRALASTGVFVEKDEKHFVHSDVSEVLKSDLPHSMKWLVMAELGQEHYRGWGNLIHSLKTGKIAFDETEGESVWEYYQKNPEDGKTFMKAMTGLSEGFNAAVVPAYDWQGFKKIADVGGGNGSLLAAILNANKNAAGILFDEPYVTNKAREVLKSKGVDERVEIISGDFFKEIPQGGDAYILKFILHDWDDEKSLRILKNIHAAMKKEAVLIIIEGVLLGGNEPQVGKLLDINMLVMTGGTERNEMEYKSLLEKSGFELLRILPTHSPMNIIEARKK